MSEATNKQDVRHLYSGARIAEITPSDMPGYKFTLRWAPRGNIELAIQEPQVPHITRLPLTSQAADHLVLVLRRAIRSVRQR